VVDFDPNTAGTQPDGTLAYATTDAGTGQNPNLVGTAYTNSTATATTTTLFAIDSNRDVLVKVDPPNNGTLLTVGALGVDTTDAVGFDIAGSADGTALASLTLTGGTSSLYTLDLATGRATLKGAVSGLVLRGIAVGP